MALNLSTISADGLAGTPQGLGARYQNVSDWLAAGQALYGDLVSRGDTAVAEGYDFECIEPLHLQFIGWVTSFTNNITMRAASGAKFEPLTNTGFRVTVTDPNAGNGINIDSDTYVILEDLAVRTSGNRSVFGIGGASPQSSDVCVQFRRSLFAANISTTTRTVALCSRYSTYTIENCIIKNNGDGGVGRGLTIDQRNGDLATNQIFNTVLTGAPPLAINSSTPSPFRFSNNALVALDGGLCVSSDPSTFLSGEILNNATSDTVTLGTAQQTGLVLTAGVDFVDPAAINFKPVPSPGKLDGTGANLSTFFLDDFDGNARSVPWTIGPYALAGAAPSISFDGPAVATINGTQNTALPSPTPDPAMNTRFTVSGGTASYALAPGSSPLPAGVTIDPTTGNLVGTPSESGTFAGIVVRGTV